MSHDGDALFGVREIPEGVVEVIVSIDSRPDRSFSDRPRDFDFERGARRLEMSFHDQDSIAAGDNAAI
jgi:hypothetical protein